MAKYQAHPYYVVSGEPEIIFDYVGVYETNSAAEIKKLDALCPTWVTCLEKQAEEAPAKSKATPKKAPAKSSAK